MAAGDACWCPPIAGATHRATWETPVSWWALLVGLKFYHQATGDPRAAESILRAAMFLVRDMWVEESAGFRSTSCPYAHVSTDNFQHGLAGIAYAWRLSGDPELGHILRRAVPKAVEALQAHGRILGSQLRAAPEVLYALAQSVPGQPISSAPSDDGGPK